MATLHGRRVIRILMFANKHDSIARNARRGERDRFLPILPCFGKTWLRASFMVSVMESQTSREHARLCAENEMPNQKEQAVPNITQSEAEHLEALLDEALRESFPASDSIAVTIENAALRYPDRVPRR